MYHIQIAVFVLTCQINIHHTVMYYLEYSNIQQHSNTRPFGDWTIFDHLNTRLVRYSDPHFRVFLLVLLHLDSWIRRKSTSLIMHVTCMISMPLMIRSVIILSLKVNNSIMDNFIRGLHCAVRDGVKNGFSYLPFTA